MYFDYEWFQRDLIDAILAMVRAEKRADKEGANP